VLKLSPPPARHGARLPFDFLLPSLAAFYGQRAAAIVLSGTGADGSIGIRAIREHAGLIIAQHPDDAAYDGMPASAIATGMVDAVLPLAEIPARDQKSRASSALPSRARTRGRSITTLPPLKPIGPRILPHRCPTLPA
ncbi:unnamed protein product, partial [Acidocella sp. C78]